jgi:hypothetical protein
MHLNIQNMKSKEIIENNIKLPSLLELQSKYSPDFFSFNEIQFDLPNVPNSNFKSKGLNLLRLNALFSFSYIDSFFSLSKTGANSKRNSQGHFSSTKDPHLADLSNFGNYPGQYSVGALSRKIIKSKLIINVPFKKFFPDISFSNFKRIDGSLYPKDLALFDKNFNHITINNNSSKLNIILLHLTPDFNFNNDYLINKTRNFHQLKFLSWYLNIDGLSKPRLGIIPLKKKSKFLVLGDLNAHPFHNSKSGEKISEIIKATNSVFPINKTNFTFPAKKLILDFGIASKNIEILKYEIIKNSISDHLPLYFEVSI